MSRRELQWRTGVLLPAADSQCGRADDYIFEGMAPYMVQGGAFLTAAAVYHMRSSMERKLMCPPGLQRRDFMQDYFNLLYSIMAHQDWR